MKKCKRLLVVGVILCLAIALVPFSSASAGDVTVSIDATAEVDSNTDFIARVNITEVTNFDAANYDITYDPLVLEVTDVTDGIIGETVIPVEIWGFIPAETQGKIRVVNNVPGFPGVSGSGYLAEIHFHVVGSAGSTSDITLSNGMLSDNTATEIPVTWVGGSVYVNTASEFPVVDLGTSYSKGIETIPYALVHVSGSPVGYTANVAHYLPVTVPFEITVNRIKIRIGTSSGNIDVGIYDRDGNRVVSTGSIACPAAGYATITIASTVLNPGIYYFAISCDNNTATFYRVDISCGSRHSFWQGNAFPLPSKMSISGEAGERYWIEAS